MRLIALAPLLMAAACGGGPLTTAGPGRGPQTVDTSAVPSGPGVENSCGAGRQISLLGRDATVLEKVMILGPVQVLRPGSIAAQDFQPDRINFIIGPDNRITQITCG